MHQYFLLLLMNLTDETLEEIQGQLPQTRLDWDMAIRLVLQSCPNLRTQPVKMFPALMRRSGKKFGHALAHGTHSLH